MTEHEKLIALIAYVDGLFGDGERYAVISKDAVHKFIENLYK